MKLTSGFAGTSKWDILERFAAGKASPPASLVYDYFKGTDYEHRPFSWKREALTHIVPLVAQDVYDLYHNTGSIPAALLGYAGSSTGLGIQTYSNKTQKKKHKGGGSGSLLQSGPGGPSNSLLRGGGSSSSSLLP